MLFVIGQILGFGTTIWSFNFFRSAFKNKDWGELFLGICLFCCGVGFILFASLPALLGDFDKLRLTYLWTFPVSIFISYFLFFYVPKTKKYKNFIIKRDKQIKKNKKNSTNQSSSFFKWLEALTSDIFMMIFYLAILLGFVFLVVKLVKYFWYL